MRKLAPLIILAFFSISYSYAIDDFATIFKNFKEAIKTAGKIDYTKSNCNCFDQSKYISKLDSPYNRQKIELSVVTEEAINRYFEELQNNDKIPYEYAFDGCYARAHKMSQLLEQKGIISGKAFVEGNLNVTSPVLGKVSWWYHVAPVVLVYKNGKEIPYVLDPSLFKRPVPFNEWRDLMIGGDKKNLDHEYFTNRFSYSPYDKFPPPKTRYAKKDLDHGQTILEENIISLNKILKDKQKKIRK